jgi:hypothetical protein
MGACGDGIELDTGAFQEAINCCFSAGGGKVYCPPGQYLIGSIELKSNVSLYLEAGANILATTERQMYQPVKLQGIPSNLYNYNEEHLIWAHHAENVTIEGRGTINGQGKLFFGPLREDIPFFTIRDWRPFQLIAFIECKDVFIHGVKFIDAPGWTIWPVGCQRVRISGVTIINHRQGPNTDGIDIDSSQSVAISDCYIDVGDDCIALKCSPEKLQNPKPCEEIVVTNCILKSTCNAIRLGFEGDDIIRNCSFSNLVITETHGGINFLVPRVPEIAIHRGPTIENISFSNIIMDVTTPFFLWIGDEPSITGHIKNIRFSNISVRAKRASYFGGSKRIPLEGIELDNVRIVLSGEMDNEFSQEIPYPYRMWDFKKKKGIPHILFFRHAKDIVLHQCDLRWGKTQGPWQSAIKLDSVSEADLRYLSIESMPHSSFSLLHLFNSRNCRIRDCHAKGKANVFLKLDGPSENVSFTQNELLLCDKAVEVGVGVQSESFIESGNLCRIQKP